MRRRVRELDPRALRNSLGLNQSEFWGRLGVTQSGGSRYENGRRMPPPVRKLLGIVYLKKKI
jgi:transcriptional regulator with XRE-family HTH domain